jgi:hypothetical protein
VLLYCSLERTYKLAVGCIEASINGIAGAGAEQKSL